MKKIIDCHGCGEKKPYHALGLCAQCYGREYTKRWRTANRDRWLSRMRRYGAQWRAKNPAKIRAQKQRQYQRKKAKRLAIIQEQVGSVCVDCGEDRPAALEYHHKDNSRNEVIIKR